MKQLLRRWRRGQKKGASKDAASTAKSPPSPIPDPLRDRFSDDDVLDTRPKTDVDQHVFSVFIRHKRNYIQVITTEDRILDGDKIRDALATDYDVVGLDEERKLLASQGLIRPPGFAILAGVPVWVDEAAVDVHHPCFTFKGYRRWVLIRPELYQSEVDAATQRLSLSWRRPDVDEVFKEKGLQGGGVLDASRIFVYQRIRASLEIPPLSQSVQRLLRMRTDLSANIQSLVEIVEKDPPMVAMILKLGASPIYAGVNRNPSLHDVIFRALGYDMTLNFLLGYALNSTMTAPKREPERALGYWGEALMVAELCRRFARATEVEVNPHTAYLTGLLHNFGYRVLAHVFPPKFDQLCDMWTLNRHANPILLEYMVLNVTRDDIAAVLLSKWALPPPIVVGVQAQNRLGYAGEHSIYACLVRLARRCLSRHGWLLEHVPIDGLCMRQIGLTQEEVRTVYADTAANIEEYLTLGKSL